jgi:hypothetical protein
VIDRKQTKHKTTTQFFFSIIPNCRGDLATVGRRYTKFARLSSCDSNAFFSVSFSSRRRATDADSSASADHARASAFRVTADASAANTARAERRWRNKSNGAAAHCRLSAAESEAEAKAFGAGRIGHPPTERTNARAGGIGLEDEGDGSGAG